MDTRRQKKVASLIQQEIAQLFQKEGSNWFGGAFVTVSGVKVTPDLAVSHVYVSIYNVDHKATVVDRLNAQAWDVRLRLGKRVRHQLRRIPELNFHLDDSLDDVFRIEDLLKEG